MTTVIERLRRIAARVCTRSAMERVIDPTLVDMHVESLDAIRRGSVWRLRRIQLAGGITIARLIIGSFVDEVVKRLGERTSDEHSAMRTTLTIFGGVSVAFIALLEAPELVRYGARLDLVNLLHLLPSTLPLAVPAALAIGLLVGLARRQLSRTVIAMIVMLTLATSALSLAALAWLAPMGNQAFRVATMRAIATAASAPTVEPVKGPNELTLIELSRHIAAARVRDGEAPRRLLLTYHMRWALACTPLVLALLAIVILRHHRLAPATLAVIALSICIAFAIVLGGALEWGRRGAVSPVTAAWFPNLLVVMTAGFITRFRLRAT